MKQLSPISKKKNVQLKLLPAALNRMEERKYGPRNI